MKISPLLGFLDVVAIIKNNSNNLLRNDFAVTQTSNKHDLIHEMGIKLN